ncbi:MAG TPA: histidine kinase [Spirillospora sp.]|nr:histidine kinase [Spirillospora sp.]
MTNLLQSRLFQRFWDVAGSVSIRVKVLGIVLGVIVMLGLFVTLQMRYVLMETLTQELLEQGDALNHQFIEEIERLLRTGNIQSLEFYLLDRHIHYSSEGHNTLVEYIQVEDGTGAVIATSRSLTGADVEANADILQLVMPSHNLGFVLKLGLAKTNIYKTVSEVTLQLLAITLIMVAVGFGAAFFLTWILTRPIYNLVEATQAVTEGDFNRRVPRWANDEIGELASAFNTMTASLAQAERERAERERLRAEYVSNVIVAQEEERKRIARELHDSTSQLLTSLLVGLKNLKESRDPDETSRRIDALREVVGHTLDEVRTLAWQLRPSALDDLGLLSALRHYIDDYQQRYTIQVDFASNGIDERLPPEIETSIYRIVQEALTNVARHSQASAASVIIDYRRNAIRIIVEDNGIGFALEDTRGRKSLGLQGIRERAALFNGRLTVESQPGHGTSLFIEIPVTEEAQVENNGHG